MPDKKEEHSEGIVQLSMVQYSVYNQWKLMVALWIMKLKEMIENDKSTINEQFDRNHIRNAS